MGTNELDTHPIFRLKCRTRLTFYKIDCLYSSIKSFAVHLFFFKMLVIFEAFPVSAPGESVGGKELVCQILMVDPVRVGVFAVRIRLCALRKDLTLLHIGIVEGIEVHCQTVGMER